MADIPDGPNAKDTARLPIVSLAEPRKNLLTVQQRGALLRGVRMRQAQLHEECEALHLRFAAVEEIDQCLNELKLLEEALAWLWRSTAAI